MARATDAWQLSDVTGVLERNGYQRIADSDDNARLQHLSSTLWYLSPKSTTAVEQYLVLEHKKTFGIYGVYIGFSSGEVRRVRSQLVTTVLSTLPKSLSANAWCWSKFDIGRALDWPLLGIPYPRERSAGFTQFEQMIEYLAAMLESVDRPCVMLDRLLSFDSPFEWGPPNHPAGRAVEAVATAKVSGHDLPDVQEKLLMAQRYLHKELRTGPTWPALIARICSY
jgi:hypothetical protein